MPNLLKKKKPTVDKETADYVFCKKYKNRWGQEMDAAKYGYKAWRFRVKK